jgi:hypothetical protein
MFSRRDIMSKTKKILLVFSFFIILIMSFFTSYFLFLDSYKKDNKVAKSSLLNNPNSIISTNVSKEDIVNKNTKIIFQVEYKKSGDIFQEKKDIDVTNILGKNKKELEELYGVQGYVIKKMDSQQIILLKSFDRYSPQKYVLDIYKEGNCIAIFKTDKEGIQSIEDPDNDIKFDTKITDIKEGDLETFLQGRKSLQFDTKEEAEENYRVLFKS